MDVEKQGNIGNSLNEVLKAFLNVLGELIRKAPLLVIFFFGLIFAGIYGLSASKPNIKLVMSVLIGIFSIGIYIRNNNFSETILTLFLGLLTVFSIEWTKSNTLIFSGVFFSFIIIFFLISSLRLAAELESILTQASTFLSVNNNKIYYKQLEKIVKTPTNYKQLGVIEKARIARYLVFIQYPIENMKSAIEIIEMIKTIYRISLDEALEFFYSFNLVINRLEDRSINYYDINSIHSRLNKLPITPNEFLEIFKNTKMTLISGNCDLNEYFEKITEFLNKGYSKTRIINELNK